MGNEGKFERALGLIANIAIVVLAVMGIVRWVRIRAKSRARNTINTGVK